MSALLGNPLLLATGPRIVIGDVFDITLDTAANLDSVSTAGWDLLIAKSRANTSDWSWRFDDIGLSNTLKTAGSGTDAAAAFSDYATILGAGNGVLYRLKEAPRFLQVATVAHTNGAATNIDFSTLGADIGMAVARIHGASDTQGWQVAHAGLSAGQNLRLNATDSLFGGYLSFSGATVTIASSAATGTYLVFVFADDAAGNGVVRAGTYTGNGSTTGPSVDLGWPEGVQFLLIKNRSSAIGWVLHDAARGFPVAGNSPYLIPSNAAAEGAAVPSVESTVGGFKLTGNNGTWNGSGDVYTYLAFRAPS